MVCKPCMDLTKVSGCKNASLASGNPSQLLQCHPNASTLPLNPTYVEQPTRVLTQLKAVRGEPATCPATNTFSLQASQHPTENHSPTEKNRSDGLQPRSDSIATCTSNYCTTKGPYQLLQKSLPGPNPSRPRPGSGKNQDVETTCYVMLKIPCSSR